MLKIFLLTGVILIGLITPAKANQQYECSDYTGNFEYDSKMLELKQLRAINETQRSINDAQVSTLGATSIARRNTNIFSDLLEGLLEVELDELHSEASYCHNLKRR